MYDEVSCHYHMSTSNEKSCECSVLLSSYLAQGKWSCFISVVIRMYAAKMVVHPSHILYALEITYSL